ncbi:dihydrofolate reductase [Ruegeria sp. R13_0]|uniref:dihydrofolate reductase family protein n=1 Tax=Ruegeria sp. R13_0 TaxID=2821099 RepID=UPI001AD9B79D|nr:dihydrofolate reductase family protein [Ruegeria sp. R13_0]MBO9436396.1 dihydrofolate reductase [Ruegeria sp. R13_0]
MQPVIYDVAVSIDGYIAGLDGDVSLFAHHGPVVDDYQSRLATYSTAIMGRQTYEFGYRFGLEPGQNPYPNMKTFVVSDTLKLPNDRAIDVLQGETALALCQLKTDAAGPIYLCGGGEFAGYLLELNLIDKLVLKRAPIILGEGTRLFGRTRSKLAFAHTGTKNYDGGYVLQQFDLVG